MPNIDNLNSTRTLLCNTGSVLAQQAEALFARQWPGFELDQSDVEGANLPPILVVLESGTLIAALAFCRYEDPQQPKQVIWINALYVIDEWRRCGVAKHLLERAVDLVSTAQQSHLYAYTNVPQLYLSAGWKSLSYETESGHHVMAFDLA